MFGSSFKLNHINIKCLLFIYFFKIILVTYFTYELTLESLIYGLWTIVFLIKKTLKCIKKKRGERKRKGKTRLPIKINFRKKYEQPRMTQ